MTGQGQQDIAHITNLSTQCPDQLGQAHESSEIGVPGDIMNHPHSVPDSLYNSLSSLIMVWASSVWVCNLVISSSMTWYLASMYRVSPSRANPISLTDWARLWKYQNRATIFVSSSILVSSGISNSRVLMGFLPFPLLGVFTNIICGAYGSLSSS